MIGFYDAIILYLYIYIYVCIYIYIHAYMHVYVCMRVYVYAYVCACPCLCIDKVVSQRYEWNTMTSSNETYFALLPLCEGYTPVTGGFPSRRPVTRSFDVLFDLRHSQTTEQSLETAVMLKTPSRSLLRHCIGVRKWIYQYGLSVTLLAKAVHGRNLLTVYVRVQWVVSWKFFGSFTPHFSNNNFFTGWYLLTRIAMGPWPVDRFCFGRLWSWSRVQSRENPH